MTHEKPSWRERLAPQATLVLIMGIVAVYDICCKKGNTLSEEIDRLRESPYTGKYTHLALDALYDHLKRNREPENDPIHRLAVLIGKDTLSHKSLKPKLTGEDRFDVFGTDD